MADTPDDITHALATLRASTTVPAIDPARERRLMDAFDARVRAGAARYRPPAPTGRMWIAASTLAGVTALLIWSVVAAPQTLKTPKAPGAAPAAPSADLAGFVAWPGASAWPPFESGRIVRIDLPVSMLPVLGLTVPPSSAGNVPADIIVGQDGLARAVRLIQQQ